MCVCLMYVILPCSHISHHQKEMGTGNETWLSAWVSMYLICPYVGQTAYLPTFHVRVISVLLNLTVCVCVCIYSAWHYNNSLSLSPSYLAFPENDMTARRRNSHGRMQNVMVHRFVSFYFSDISLFVCCLDSLSSTVLDFWSMFTGAENK